MKITKEQLIDLLSVTLGDDVLPLVHLLWKKSNTSEFKLAEKLNITVNQTRNMLYRLSELNLVSFMRKKDKRKGWYIYYWSIKKSSAFNAVWRFKKKRLEQFVIRLENEKSGVFYVCPTGCMRMSMAKAMEFDFRCQECGSLLGQQDNSRTIANVSRMIEEMKEELQDFEKQVLEARAKRRELETKREVREEEKIKRELDKKKAEKKALLAIKRKEAAKIREANKALKKKLAKKTAKKKKKVSKKKVTKKNKKAAKKSIKKISKKKISKKKKSVKKPTKKAPSKKTTSRKKSAKKKKPSKK